MRSHQPELMNLKLAQMLGPAQVISPVNDAKPNRENTVEESMDDQSSLEQTGPLSPKALEEAGPLPPKAVMLAVQNPQHPQYHFALGQFLATALGGLLLWETQGAKGFLNPTNLSQIIGGIVSSFLPQQGQSPEPPATS